MKRYLTHLLLISLNIICTADAKPKPQRGFPDPIPFIPTECKLLSLHLPSFEDPPQPFSEMPRVAELDTKWAHTKSGDEVYNITSWFPLNTMKLKDENKEQRWVYYNKSSGYIISYADQFLQSSIYLYVKEKLFSEGFRQRVSFTYFSVDDKAGMNLEELRKSSPEVLMSSSAMVISGEKSDFKSSGSELEVEMISSEESLSADISLNLYLDGMLEFSSSMAIPVNQWIISESGFSSEGSRRVMMIKVENVNSKGQVIHLPPDYSLFVETLVEAQDDPFGEEEAGCMLSYRVPRDIIRLLDEGDNHDYDDDPFGEVDYRIMDDDGLKNTEYRVNISHILAKHGIRIDAYYFTSVSYVFAFGDESDHEKLDELFATLGPHEPYTYKIGLHFYEIDAVEEEHTKGLKVEDVLAENPVRIASVGAVTRSGQRADIYHDKSEYKVEPIRDESGDFVDLMLTLKLDMSGLKLEREFELDAIIDVPDIFYLGESKSGRDQVMMVSVSEIEYKKDK
jgi:hypothetical protein